MLAKPDGPAGAAIAIVAARPGKHEVGLCDCGNRHPVGIGLVGPSGSLLWKLLSKYGILRKDCYVTNVRKDYSATHSVPTKQECLEARDALLDEIDKINPNIVLALGNEALLTLTGHQSIEKWRGSIIPDLRSRKTLASWHPAACFRTPQWTYVLDADLERLAQESRSPKISRLRRDLIIDPTLDICVSTLRDFQSPVCVDIETFGRNISCIGVADSAQRAICIPFAGPMVMSLTERAYAARELFRVLRNPIYGQNVAMFDIPLLRSHGYDPGTVACDSMLAHHLLWPELGMKSRDANSGIEKFAGSHDLAFLTSMYTDIPYYKDMAQRWRSERLDWKMYWEYNCLDCVATYEACEKLLAELSEFHQLEYFREAVLGLCEPILRMQETGMLVDSSQLSEVRRRTDLEIQYLQLQLKLKTGFNCNVRSTTDIRYLISDVLHIGGLTKSTRGGKPSTDKETLRSLAYSSPYTEIFKLILDIRERRTLMSSFLTMEVGSDGRYRARYKIHGTDSGRLSSQSPGGFEGRRGPQLQNIPKSARRLFVAKRDHVFIQCDLRRAEAMFVAADSGDVTLLELFSDPSRDLYREAAGSALGRDPQEIDDTIRQIFKHVVLASNYGMGATRLIGVLRTVRSGINIEDIPIRGISRPKAKAEFFLESYHSRYPGVRRWQQRIRDEVHRTRTLYDAFGRRRFFMGRLRGKEAENTERIAFSYRPQASVAGITNRALRALRDWSVVSQVHDSLMIEVPLAAQAEGVAALEAAMTFQVQTWNEPLVIPVDTTIGPSWG